MRFWKRHPRVEKLTNVEDNGILEAREQSTEISTRLDELEGRVTGLEEQLHPLTDVLVNGRTEQRDRRDIL